MRSAVGWVVVVAQFGLLATLVLLPGRSDWPTPVWLDVSSWGLIGSAVVVIVASARALGRSLTPNPVPRDGSRLVTRGLYGRVRHPIYSGVFLLVIGLVLRSGSWTVGAVGGATIGFFAAKARLEERYLVSRSRGYDAYAEMTPRFVPRIKARGTPPAGP